MTSVSTSSDTIAGSRSAGHASRRFDAYEKRLAILDYMDEMSVRPWIWGETDCTMSVAKWINLVTDLDPLGKYRGTYHNADEARETARRAGGFVPTVSRLLDEAGFERTFEPEIGDVGIVIVPLAERKVLPVVGAILAIRAIFSNLWLCKSMRGLACQPFQAFTAWRL